MTTRETVRLQKLGPSVFYASACWLTLVACSAKDGDAETSASSATVTDGSTVSSSAALSSTGTATTGAAATATQSVTTGANTSSTTSTATSSATASATATNVASTTATASTTGAGGASASTGTGPTETSGGGSGGQGNTGGVDPLTFASELDGLFIDVPCQEPTPVPLPDEATCDHPTGTQRIEESVVFGGEAATTYSLTLRVRGIWEPTFISGGEAPDAELPFKIGGEVAEGNAIDYQQFFITVSDPAETYWLNDYQYTAHDIHKADYEITIPVVGGASVTVVMNDGNERQIANYPEEIFDDLPPYDQEPTKGQLLQLQVVSVSAQ